MYAAPRAVPPALRRLRSRSVVTTSSTDGQPQPAADVFLSGFNSPASSRTAVVPAANGAQVQPLTTAEQGDAQASPQAVGSQEEDKERMRRSRISQANKGRTPWNKGRRHSPETIAKIKERTKLAMQRPEVLAKLKEMPHPKHSEETKEKIREALRQRTISLGKTPKDRSSSAAARQKLRKAKADMTPEERAAVAADDAQRKLEHRRRISEAIKAKWKDPAYRNRIVGAMVRPEVQAKRVRSQKAQLATVRQVLNVESDRVAVITADRSEKLGKAMAVVQQCEAAVRALQQQRAAFANDPHMAQRADGAIQQAKRMLSAARQQMAQMEAGTVGSGSAAGAAATPASAGGVAREAGSSTDQGKGSNGSSSGSINGVGSSAHVARSGLNGTSVKGMAPGASSPPEDRSERGQDPNLRPPGPSSAPGPGSQEWSPSPGRDAGPADRQQQEHPISSTSSSSGGGGAEPGEPQGTASPPWQQRSPSKQPVSFQHSTRVGYGPANGRPVNGSPVVNGPPGYANGGPGYANGAPGYASTAPANGPPGYANGAPVHAPSAPGYAASAPGYANGTPRPPTFVNGTAARAPTPINGAVPPRAAAMQGTWGPQGTRGPQEERGDAPVSGRAAGNSPAKRAPARPPGRRPPGPPGAGGAQPGPRYNGRPSGGL